jgi:hypothetical protein
MFFFIMDTKFPKDFYLKKMKLNPSNEALLFGFESALLKWVQSSTLEALIAKEILLDTHYRFDYVRSMVELKGVIDTSRLSSFL